jgi:hypothetical protein
MLPTFDFISNHIASIPSTCRSILGTILILSLKYIIIPPPYVFLSNLNGLELKPGINKLLVGTRWSKWVSVNQTISKSWTICTMSSILFLKLLILRWHILIDDWNVRVVSPCVGPGFSSISADSNKHNFIKQIIKAILMTLPWKIWYDSKAKYRQYLTNK